MTDPRESRERDAEMTGSTVEQWRIELRRKDAPPPAGAAHVMAALVRLERERGR